MVLHGDKVKALYIPGPSFHDPQVREYAGWAKILDYQLQGIEKAGFDVTVAEVPKEYIDAGTSFSQIASYSLYIAANYPIDSYKLIIGAQSYMHYSIMRRNPAKTRAISFVWNNADWHRDVMLKDEYAKHHGKYTTLPINTVMNDTALRMSDCVVACCPFVKNTHIQISGLANKVKVAFWGVDSEMFSPALEQPSEFKVLFPGTDPIRKGLVYMLGTMRLLQDLEIKVVLCGGQYTVRDASNFESTGMIPHSEMPDVMRQCSIVLLPTLEDGLACSVQEAMACGVVPITTDTAADPFEHNVSGFRIPYRDSEKAAEYIRLLKGNPSLLLCMSHETRIKALTQTWGKYINDLSNIIKKVCE